MAAYCISRHVRDSRHLCWRPLVKAMPDKKWQLTADAKEFLSDQVHDELCIRT